MFIALYFSNFALMDSFQIGPARLGPAEKPFVVAELSGNHNGSLERALALVDAAADSGAHAIKLQTYTADTMTLNITTGEFLITDPNSLWHGRNLYDLYQEAMTPWEWHKPIFDRAKSRGMAAFSSPFDASAVDFLETLEVPAYKIASMENTDWPLLNKVAKTVSLSSCPPERPASPMSLLLWKFCVPMAAST